ncbi:MAG: rhodanese-like domain-containing protein [Verrucomicrobiota bacterium]
MIRIHKYLLPAAVVLGMGTAVFLAVRKSPSPPVAQAQVEAASFTRQAAALKPGNGSAAEVNLGLLGLGSIRELDLTLNFEGTAGIQQVESSCSCLQPLGGPRALADGKTQNLQARYMAVRPGPVDVTLAFSRTGADGKEEILTARVTGTVAAGDTALAERLAEMVKAPLPPRADRDESGVVSAADARREVEAGRGVLVDIRPPEEFSRSHIPGALNIPQTQLKPSGAFRGRDLYLTGPSLPTVSLLEARRGLLRHGAAKVFVVSDGVAGWKAAGGLVFQEMDPPPVLNAITAADLRESAGSPRLAVVGIEPADEFAFRYYFPGGQPVKAADLTAAVEARLSADSSARVVIVDGRGDRFGAVNQAAPAAWLGRVGYLRESFETYRGAVDQMGLLASRVPGESSGSAKGFARRTPGQRVGVPMSPGSPGCGTCPKK